LGRGGLNYSYIPAAGWRPGTYTLWLELRVGGAPYTTSPEEQLVVGAQPEELETTMPATPPAPPAPAAPVSVAQESPISGTVVWVLCGIVAVPVIGAGISIVARGRTDSKRYW